MMVHFLYRFTILQNINHCLQCLLKDVTTKDDYPQGATLNDLILTDEVTRPKRYSKSRKKESIELSKSSVVCNNSDADDSD